MAGETRPNDPEQFFTADEQNRIAEVIHAAEAGTTGELVVRVERRCPGDPLEHSRKLLESLGVVATKEHTGVLIYISIEDHKVAIYGDQAIHEKIGTDGWTNICDHMSRQFHEGHFVEGLCEAITHVGRVLHEHFPAQAINVNELPNKPSFGE